MGESETKDKATMKLPGKTILLFLAVASGVFVVYYFTSRSNDLQNKIDRQSDLVWLQKILDEKSQRLTQKRPWQLKQDAKYYGSDDFDNVGNDADDDYRGESIESDYVWATPMWRRKVTKSPSPRFPFRLKSEQFNKGSNTKNKIWANNDESDTDWTTPWDRREHVLIDQPRLDSWDYDKTYVSKNDRLNSDKTHGNYDHFGTDTSQRGKVLSRNGFENPSPVNNGELARKQSSITDYVDNPEQNEQFATSTKYDIYNSISSMSPRIKTSTTAATTKLLQTNTDSEANDRRQETTKANHGNQRYWPIRKDHKDTSYVDTGKALLKQSNVESFLDDMKTSYSLSATTAAAKNVLLNKENERLSKDSFARQIENGKDQTRPSKLLNALLPHSVVEVNKFDKTKELLDAKPESENINNKAEPLAGATTAMKETVNELDEIADVKKHTIYPNNIDVFDWKSTPHSNTNPECVALQTISSYVRICIHPVKEDPDTSAMIKSRSSWEFTSMRDLELAILQDKTYGLIDLGAGIGEYSLAVASLKRHVVAVEPYQPHIDLFQKSVQLSKLGEYITLIRNVISDNNDQFSMRHKQGHISDVQFEKATNQQVETNNFTRAITLNQLAPVIPFKRAVMKIDIPKFTQRALSEADELFDSIDIRFVFTHWSYKEESLNTFLVEFFQRKGYQPYAQLNSLMLSLDKYKKWKNPFIVWAKI